LIKNSLQDIALAFSVDLQPNQILVYIEALEDLSELQIRHAFKRAVKSWRPAYGQKFPSVADLREYAEEINAPVPPPQETLEINPENLPKGWTLEQWRAAKITMKIAREQSNRPMPYDPNAPPNETKPEYAKRLIAELRQKISAGMFDFPGAKK
jgi:hypothetical protein